MIANRARPHWWRLALLAPGMAALAAAVLGGLVRMGWASPAPGASVAFHGALMVSGFFGTLIALERAVALGRAWAYSAPLAGAAGVIALLASPDWRVGAALVAAGSAAFLAASLAVVAKQRAAFTITMAAGAACAVVANALWLAGRPVYELVPWWMCFLVLTIAGERLELSRLVRIPELARRAFVPIAAASIVAAALASRAPDASARLLGLSFVALAAWLAQFDVARRTVKLKGLPRFVAHCLLAGYAWLGVSGALLVLGGTLVPGLRYDAALHAIFLGFVFSMVFGHAPIIFPAVVRLPVRFGPASYAPLVLLHATLAVRVGADLAGAYDVRRWAGIGNAAAIALFVGGIAFGVVRERRRAPAAGPVAAAGR